MDINSPEEKAFLYELYTQTKGNTEAQISMHDVGTALGLEKNEAGSLAENLFIQGFAELKTLSGGIGITDQGMKVLDIKPPPRPGDDALKLGKTLVLEAAGKKAVEKILKAIKENSIGAKPSYDTLEELIMDIKTIEVQMMSPRPKTQIIREILRSLSANIEKNGPEDLAAGLNALIAS